MTRKKERFVVWVHVKPYVKKYLLQNFRVEDTDWPELVNVSRDRELGIFVNSRLEKPCHRRDKQSNSANSKRTALLAVEITEDNFYRNGWSLSPSDECAFDKAVSIRCDTMLMVLLSGFYMFTGNLMESIRRFYDITGFTDNDWPIDSIRKKWQRDATVLKITLNDEIIQKNTSLLLDKLSKNGTISQIAKNTYEKNDLQP